MDIEQLAAAIDGYSSKTNAGLQSLTATADDLKARLDRIELSENRKSVTGGGDDSHAADASGWIDQAGNPVPILGKSDYTDRRKMAKKLGVSRENPFNVGDFIKGVAGVKTKPEVRSALSEGVSTEGGYMVPEALLPTIIAALAPASAALQAGARIVPIDSTTAGSFRIARVDTPPVAAWRGENAAVAESLPVFGAITFQPKSLAFYFKVSMELLQDAPNIDQILTEIIGQAFAVGMDKAALIGSGSGAEPLGLLYQTGLNSVSMGVDGLAPTSYDPILDALYETELDNAPPASAMLAHPRTWRTFRKFKTTFNEPITAPPEVAALARYASTHLPITETQGSNSDCSSLLLGDFTKLMFGMRRGLAILRADQAHAGNGQVGFYAFARMDVAVEQPKAFCKIVGIRA